MITSLKNFQGSSIVKVLLVMILTAGSYCTNGQSHNIYSEENWEDRDKWQMPELIIEQLEVGFGDHVADIGCHEGYMTIKLANHVGTDGTVYAVDIKSYRLDNLKKNLEERGIESVKVIEGDYDDPKLPKDSLDAVLILDAYHEMDEFKKILKHIKSALREEGRLVILEPIRDSFRGKSRSAQEDKHEIEMRYVKEDLANAGFRIIKEQDPFIDRIKPKGDNLWVLVAVKE